MKKINGTWFNIEFCKNFSAEKLRVIYNGEGKETIDALIAEIYPEKSEKAKSKK